jgi:hypothetical protein
MDLAGAGLDLFQDISGIRLRIVGKPRNVTENSIQSVSN